MTKRSSPLPRFPLRPLSRVKASCTNECGGSYVRASKLIHIQSLGVLFKYGGKEQKKFRGKKRRREKAIRRTIKVAWFAWSLNIAWDLIVGNELS